MSDSQVIADLDNIRPVDSLRGESTITQEPTCGAVLESPQSETLVDVPVEVVLDPLFGPSRSTHGWGSQVPSVRSDRAEGAGHSY